MQRSRTRVSARIHRTADGELHHEYEVEGEVYSSLGAAIEDTGSVIDANSAGGGL